jgi:transcriptional antiterminator NusG
MADSWYVVECFENREADVHLRLTAARFKTLRPVDVVESTVRGAKGQQATKRRRRRCIISRYGRYLFVQTEMNPYVFDAVKNISWVKGWICYAGSNEPAAIPDSLIELCRAPTPQPSDAQLAIRKGDKVRVKSGPFEHFEGIAVSAVDKRACVKVELALFGRLMPLIFKVGHVELVELWRTDAVRSSMTLSNAC